jgi:hypothetical protein
MMSLLLQLGLPALLGSIVGGAHNVTLSTSRFPMEGTDPPVTLCSDPPLLSGSLPLTAQISQPGISLRFPTRAHNFMLAPPTPSGAAGCFVVGPGETQAPGPGYLSIAAGGNATQAAEVEYYESVAVAFGLRPYITEANGTLLLLTDRDVLTQASRNDAGAVSVVLHLPFATPPRSDSWGGTGADVGLLTQPEQVLSFSLDNLPSTINQDVRIDITLPSGKTITKWRRLARAPPLPTGSSVLPVQVDHSIKSLLVDGRPHAGTGFYLSWDAQAYGAFANMTEYIEKSLAPGGLNHGMVYRLHALPPAEMLYVLDRAHSVGFKVMLDMPTDLDDCGKPGPPNMNVGTRPKYPTCFNDTESPGLASLLALIGLVKGHPALLGYYICDDCCQSDVGAAYQAQGYNIIKQNDPYHVVVGASDCGDVWTFFDNAVTCTNRNGTETKFPWDVCPPATANTSLAVIPFGEQPTTQLSLDYLLQENYAGGLASHAGRGHWDAPGEDRRAVQKDGWFRAPLPFEPLANCPSSIHDTRPISSYSQAWMSAVVADMWDQLIFAGGPGPWTAVATQIATHMEELRPSFRRKFGSSQRATVIVEQLGEHGGCVFHDKNTVTLPGGLLRAAVWTEVSPSNASAVCAHLVVVNAALEATLPFRATLSGVPGTAGRFDLKATRMFTAGPTLNVSVSQHGGEGLNLANLTLTPDMIGPGQTAIYRIGCDSLQPDPANLASPLVSGGPNDPQRTGWSAVPPAAVPGDKFGQALSDARITIVPDTAVAVSPARHSLRVNVPSNAAVVLPLPGTHLVPVARKFAPDPKLGMAKPGDVLVGSSTTLPGGQTFKVAVELQASPCGTQIEVMGGGWSVTSVDCLNDLRGFCVESVEGVYHGVPLAPSVMPCGAQWTRLEALVRSPPANATANGTALQLRLTPLSTGHGAAVWIGSASVVAASATFIGE